MVEYDLIDSGTILKNCGIDYLKEREGVALKRTFFTLISSSFSIFPLLLTFIPQVNINKIIPAASAIVIAESKIENEAVSKYGEYLKADVYKVGHHGSSTSSSAKFLNEVLPEYAIVSAGKKNSYGHPTQTVLNKLQNVGAEVLNFFDNKIRC